MLSRILMSTCILGISLFSMPHNADAASRITTTTQNCTDLKRTIIAQGAAILRFPGIRDKSIKRFDRFVASNAFCQRGEIAEWSMAPAKDTRQCRLLTCQRFDPSNYDFAIPYRRLRIK